LDRLIKLRKIIRLEIYFAANPDFKDHRMIADSASNLINDKFGVAENTAS
jgi:hypothetical protein